ncbi:MAG: hypothetical protein MJ252_17645, partial [archaeon]|nr:hypothetical protein [archaeon]
MSESENILKIPKSHSTNLLFTHGPKTCTAKSSDNIFRKIYQSYEASTNGECPEIIYKKQPNKINFLLEMNLRNTELINDAGYEKKRKFQYDYKNLTQSMRNVNNPIGSPMSSPTNMTSTRFNNKMAKTARLNDNKKTKIFNKTSKSFSPGLTQHRSEPNIFHSKKASPKTESQRDKIQPKHHHKHRLSEEQKKAKIDVLIENTVKGYVKKFNSDNENTKTSKEEDELNRKLKALEEDGVVFNESIFLKEIENEEEEKRQIEEREKEDEDKSYNDFLKDEELKISSDNTPIKKQTRKEGLPKNIHFSPMILSSNSGFNTGNIDLPQSRALSGATTRRKPQVDGFEYLMEISKQKKELGYENEKDSENFRRPSRGRERPMSECNEKVLRNNFLEGKKEDKKAHTVRGLPKKCFEDEKKEKEEEEKKFNKVIVTYQNLLNLELKKKIKKLKEEKYKSFNRNHPDKNKYVNKRVKAKTPKALKIKNDYFIGDYRGGEEVSTIVDNDNYYANIINGKLFLNEKPYVDNDKYMASNKKSFNNESPNRKSDNDTIETLKRKAFNTIKKMNEIEKKEDLHKLIKTGESENNSNKDTLEVNQNKERNKPKEETNQSNKPMDKSKNSSYISHGSKRDLVIESNDDMINPIKKDKNNPTTTSNLNTKEVEIPSLPHNFQDETNPNKKIEIEVEPQAVFRLVETIRIIIQRRIFYPLMQSLLSKIYIGYGLTLLTLILKRRAFYDLFVACHYFGKNSEDMGRFGENPNAVSQEQALYIFEIIKSMADFYVKNAFDTLRETVYNIPEEEEEKDEDLKDKLNRSAEIPKDKLNRSADGVKDKSEEKPKNISRENSKDNSKNVSKNNSKNSLKEKEKSIEEKHNTSSKKEDSPTKREIESKKVEEEEEPDKVNLDESGDKNKYDALVNHLQNNPEKINIKIGNIRSQNERNRYQNTSDSQLSEISQKSNNSNKLNKSQKSNRSNRSNKSSSSVKDLVGKKGGISLDIKKGLQNQADREHLQKSISERSISKGNSGNDNDSSERIRIRDFSGGDRPDTEESNKNKNVDTNGNKSSIDENEGNQNRNKEPNKDSISNTKNTTKENTIQEKIRSIEEENKKEKDNNKERKEDKKSEEKPKIERK